jgi:hypothetical protein
MAHRDREASRCGVVRVERRRAWREVTAGHSAAKRPCRVFAERAEAEPQVRSAPQRPEQPAALFVIEPGSRRREPNELFVRSSPRNDVGRTLDTVPTRALLPKPSHRCMRHLGTSLEPRIDRSQRFPSYHAFFRLRSCRRTAFSTRQRLSKSSDSAKRTLTRWGDATTAFCANPHLRRVSFRKSDQERSRK